MTGDLTRCARCRHFRYLHRTLPGGDAGRCGTCNCPGYTKPAARAAPTPPDDPPTLFGPPAVEYNVTGSETGRVFRDAPQSVRDAAEATDATSHRAIILRALAAAGPYDRHTNTGGITSKEAARLLPRTADGDAQLSNRSSSRLGELWEAGEVTIVRAHGACVLGVCHQHEKPRTVHRPTAPCAGHGAPLRRGGANIWTTTEGTGHDRAVTHPSQR